MNDYDKYMTQDGGEEVQKLVDSIVGFVSVANEFIIKPDISHNRKIELINSLEILGIIINNLKDGLLLTIPEKGNA